MVEHQGQLDLSLLPRLEPVHPGPETFSTVDHAVGAASNTNDSRTAHLASPISSCTVVDPAVLVNATWMVPIIKTDTSKLAETKSISFSSPFLHFLDPSWPSFPLSPPPDMGIPIFNSRSESSFPIPSVQLL